MSKIGFMAGCNLSVYSPYQVEQVLLFLRTIYGKNLRAISNCCGKPTLIMLGETEHFRKKYDLLESDFSHYNLDTVIVACQNCYKTISNHSNIKVLSLWNVLSEHMKIETNKRLRRSVISIQDSCSVRNVPSIHNSVRNLIRKKGYSIEESKYCKEQALCCGMVVMLRPAISKKALAMAEEGMPAHEVVSYCGGGCHSMFLRTEKKGTYLLDILFGTESKTDKTLSLVGGYRNRFKTKKIIDSFNKKQSNNRGN